MTQARRQPVVERASLGAHRYRASPDDAARLEAIWHALRHIPRENIESMQDVINYVHRCVGGIPAIISRLELVEPRPARIERARLATRPSADHAAVVAGVFGAAPRTARACMRTREVVSRRGDRVKVVERSAGQLEMVL